MDVYNVAFEWTDTNRHWLVEVPIRVAAYLIIALIARYLIHRAIDRATTGRNPKIVAGAQPDAGESSAKKPPLLRNLRERAGSTNAAKVAARRQQRAQTIGSVLKSTVSIVLLVWVVLTILNVFGVNIAPFIASAGVVGLAIGFGAQNLVRDFVTGVFMLLEDQYGVGDTVDLGEATGTVEAVSLRITRLRDVNGTVWYVRNGEILRVGNQSQNWARTVLDVTVSYDADLDLVQRILQDVATSTYENEQFHDVIIEAPEVWGVERFDKDGVVVRVVLKTAPAQQWLVARAMRQRIKAEFDRAGIKMPTTFPVATIHQEQG